MCLPPGAIKARPCTTRSPLAASLTRTWHTLSSRAAKAAVNFSGMCWTMTMPGQTRGSDVSTSSSAWVPPVDVPMATTRSVVCTMALLSAGGRAHRRHQFVGAVVQELLQVQPRLGDDGDGAGGQRFHRGLRALLGQRRTDHHRRRMLGHDLFQKRDAVHARHFHIEHDHVRPLGFHAFHRQQRIGHGVADADAGGRVEQGAEHLPHHGRIVDDHDLDITHAFSLTRPAGDATFGGTCRHNTSPLLRVKIICRCPSPNKSSDTTWTPYFFISRRAQSPFWRPMSTWLPWRGNIAPPPKILPWH